ncbi:hypothetical protein BHE74_00031629, partial [Ensete ventricosum]
MHVTSAAWDEIGVTCRRFGAPLLTSHPNACLDTRRPPTGGLRAHRHVGEPTEDLGFARAVGKSGFPSGGWRALAHGRAGAT